MSENNKSEHIGADGHPSPKKSIKKKIFKQDQWYPSAAVSIGIANRKHREVSQCGIPHQAEAGSDLSTNDAVARSEDEPSVA